MLEIDKPLITSHLVNSDVQRICVLNEGVTLSDLDKKITKSIRHSTVLRKCSTAKSKRTTKY